MPEIRVSTSSKISDRIHALREHWGHRWLSDTVAALVNEAHDRLLTPTNWPQQQKRAYSVLSRLKPGLIFSPEEIKEVRFVDSGKSVEILVSLNNTPYRVSKKTWEET